MWWFVGMAWALEGVGSPPPELVRVASPDVPGALASPGGFSLLEAPPEDPDLPWVYETMAVPDGDVGRGSPSVMNTEAWHAAGFRGQGVRVAIFDIQWNGADITPDALGPVQTADCWRHPSCEVAMDNTVSRFGYEQGGHGFACADIVREVAPDAEISLVRVNGFSTFSAAADWAIRHDIDIVSMSMSFFNDSLYDGTGPFDAVLQRMEANGVLLVSSAGNYARQHWRGPFLDPDGDDVMAFGDQEYLPITFRGTGRRTLFLQWDEHRTCGLTDLDAWVLDPNGDIVGRGERRQFSGDGCQPFERVNVQVSTGGEHRLVVFSRRAVTPFLEVDVFATSATIVGGDPAFSMADPANHPLAFTVGAVRADAYLRNDIEGFSSQGPVRSGVPKPNIAGPNGLDGPVYGAEGFFGTSASTPAVAGAVALVKGRYPDLTSREAAQRLQTWAWSDTQGVDDPRWGAGKARLPPPEVATGCGGQGMWVWLVWPWAWGRRRWLTLRRAAE